MKPSLMLGLLTLHLSFSSLVLSQDTPNKYVITQEALDIHHSGMLFDGHNDLPWEIRTKANA
ncbi:MAG TPA: hypothetical protein VLA12_00305, partial [Planctomycetaceae bacterium]|nr:hypothetical protein [Planctomycetaceae bacterium]